MGYIGNQPQYDITVNKKQYIASAGQTTFAIGYDTYVDVYVDGVLLATSEYNATTGTSVMLNTPLSGGEVVQLSGFTTLGIAITVNSIVKTAGDSSSGSTDTYTITMTDGTTSQFNVYNGIDGSVPLVDNLTSTSTTEALTAAQGKVLQDTKQEVLVSGTNIKTVNGNSILGSGDIEIDTSDKLSLSGGTMTGAITALRETSATLSTGDIDLATGNMFTKTISGATTLTISNALTSPNVNSFVLELTNGGAFAVNWFSGVKWAGGTAPTLTASGKDILSFYSIDGGTTWNVLGIQKDVK